MDMSHAATCLAMLRKVEDISTFLATRNARFCSRCRLQNWGVTREIFLATCLSNFDDGDRRAGEIHTRARAREISRRHDARGAPNAPHLLGTCLLVGGDLQRVF